MMQDNQMEMLSILGEFIKSNPDARELKRALAVRLALGNTPYFDIAELLGVHKSFITFWKQEFYEFGIAGLKLGYCGAKSFLSPAEREEIIHWLKTKDYWNLDELVTHLDLNYNVIYKSKKSYY
ncbi:helix-turn-helix domain-containing protein, partial [Gloeomargarita lithophora]|uniref:helix-turn-helix domain-containing protein n=1 Tax=Gloeomargarita lithophora TaxID=1188228 RepID=UPI003F6F2F7D